MNTSSPNPPEVSGEVLEAMARAHEAYLAEHRGLPNIWLLVDNEEGTEDGRASFKAARLAAMSAALKAGGVVEALAPFAEVCWPQLVGENDEEGDIPDFAEVECHAPEYFVNAADYAEPDKPLTVGDFRRAASIFTQGEQS